MRTDHDVVVVGARCAGAATAMLLAQRGHRVLMVDKARFPSDVPQGHFIHRHGPPRLQRWGLLDRIVASGAPPITRLTTHFGDFPLVARDLVVDGVPWGCGPRRRVLDEILVDAATSAGAELCESFIVEDVLREGDAVAGIRGRIATEASTIQVRARLTIGADGKRSRIATAVAAPSYAEVAPLTCCYFSYWSGLPDLGMEYHVQKERRAVFAFPTNDGLYAVFVFFPIEEFAQVRTDIEGNFRAVFQRMGTAGQHLLAARREERFYGTADLPNFVRKPFGPGWALSRFHPVILGPATYYTARVSIESPTGLTVLDLTRRLEAGMAIYSDDGYSDPPFERREWCTVASRGFQVSEVRLGTQTGTHIDAPAHFVAGGATLDELPVDRLVGRYFLVDLPARASDSIVRLCGGFAGEPILFLRGPGDGAARMSMAGLERLLALPPRVWVLDGAVDVEGRPPLEFHRVIAGAGIYLVEDLERDAARAVRSGGEVLALPLALMGTSGSPCRVVVRQRTE